MLYPDGYLLKNSAFVLQAGVAAAAPTSVAAGRRGVARTPGLAARAGTVTRRRVADRPLGTSRRSGAAPARLRSALPPVMSDGAMAPVLLAMAQHRQSRVFAVLLVMLSWSRFFRSDPPCYLFMHLIMQSCNQ